MRRDLTRKEAAVLVRWMVRDGNVDRAVGERESAMSSYARVAHGMWGDEKFRSLSRIKPSAQALWLYLITGPHNRGVPGLFALSRAVLAEELQWSTRDVERCFAEIEALGMARADWANRLVWLPNGPRHDYPANPNVVAGWWRQLSPLPECKLLVDALGGLKAWCAEQAKRPRKGSVAERLSWVEAFEEALSKAFREAFLKAFREGCLARVPSPSPSPFPSSAPGNPFPPPGGAAEREKASPGPDPAPPPTVADEPEPRAEPEPDATFRAAWNRGRERHRYPPESPSKRLRECWEALIEAAAGDAELGCLAIAEWFGQDWERCHWSPNVFPRYASDMVAAAAAKRDRHKGPSGPPPKLYPPSDCREFVGLRPTEPELRPYAKAGEFTPEDLARIRDEILAGRGASEPPGERFGEPNPVARDATRRGTLGSLVDAKRAADVQPISADELDRRRRAAIDALT